MRYKRLHSRLKGSSAENTFDQLANAFEAEGQVLQHSFAPLIHHPVSDYGEEIERIRTIDAKLGRTFERLNRHQRHAVFHEAQHVILSAMVGSGKTTVLIAKLFYLHFIAHVPFDQIVVLTFTNKAAREIKERIAAFLGEVDSTMKEQLRYFGTFHAVARQLLQEHPKLEKIGFKPGFLIMDEQEKQEFLERLIAQENLTIKYENQLAKRWRNYHRNGEIMMGNMKAEDDFEQLVRLAESEKRALNTMDFDDLIGLCNRLLEEQVPASPKWIIVDEFQDCNAEQLQLIEQLRGNDSKLFVVGDQNQSIYGWRGSKERLFQEVQSSWEATWMELPQNYRSTGTILSAAESLLNQNEGALIATRQSGMPIDLVRHFDDQQEAYYLREQMLSLKQDNIALDTVAILFRTHQQIKIVETVFGQAAIPHQLVKRTELHENPAQTFLLRIFKLCINPNDFDACLSVSCDPTFGALKRTPKLIQTLHLRESGTSVLQAMHQYLEKRKTSAKEHLQLLEQVEKFKQEFLSETEDSAQQLIDFLALRSILKPTSIHHEAYLTAITEAWDQLKRYMKEQGWGDASSIFHVALDQVVLEGTFQINNRIKEEGQGVHLLTIHASKGLEFDRVYIAGANTGVIPLTQHQKGSQNIKEEKRLLFVAMTRGKNKVEIGWHAQPALRNAEPKPSYFLNSIPDTLLNHRVSVSSAEGTTEPEVVDEWPINRTVLHKKYGAGKVTSVDDKELICTFDSVGEKSFSKAFAKVLLTKVE
ncbi:ATP-dependent helicase [Mangrovibacterium lignilyticum]|uniref:ATP-dependent helicase n=1 Tax=Mangrovibacterium lignilyticum TaxID=2668052 RepID=UPI0013D6EC85|nr:ATP-dependent helicase [Mangrovibacterium lignilyticum]